MTVIAGDSSSGNLVKGGPTCPSSRQPLNTTEKVKVEKRQCLCHRVAWWSVVCSRKSQGRRVKHDA